MSDLSNRLDNCVISILGAGQLGSSLLEGLLHSGIDPHRIYVSTRREEGARRLAQIHSVNAASASQAARHADLIVIATRPTQVENLLADIAQDISPSTPVVSLAAKVTLAQMRSYLPTQPLARLMPNPPLAVASSAMAWSDLGDHEIYPFLRTFFSRLGTIVTVEEDLIDICGALTGHGQAVIYAATEAIATWGAMQGLSHDDSLRLAKACVQGAADAMSSSDQPIDSWTKRTCTPGGSTVRTVAALEAHGFKGRIISSLDGDQFRNR